MEIATYIDLTIEVVDLTEDTPETPEFECPICMTSQKDSAMCSGGHVACIYCLKKFISINGLRPDGKVGCCSYSYCKGSLDLNVVFRD